MYEPLRIGIGDLRHAISVALDELERASGDELSLDCDYYWDIRTEERYRLDEPQDNFVVGQISELISHVGTLVEHPERATRLHLVWLGDLLKAIGEIAPT